MFILGQNQFLGRYGYCFGIINIWLLIALYIILATNTNYLQH